MTHPIMTPEDVAERWQCSAQQVRKLLGAGALSGFRLGGKLWRVRIEDVEAFERLNTNTTAPETVQAIKERQTAAVDDLNKLMHRRRLIAAVDRINEKAAGGASPEQRVRRGRRRTPNP